MKLFYREYGSAEKVILIAHGLYGASDNWVTIARVLEKTYRVIVVDLRNHGKSPHSEVHTYYAMANDIKELLNDLSITKANFIGHSMGGKAIMQFALSYPQMVNKIAILDIAPKSYANFQNYGVSTNNHPAILTTMLSLNFTTIKARGEIEQYIRNKIGDDSISNFLLKNVARKEDGSYKWKLNIDALYNNLGEILDGFSHYSSSKTNTFTGPTLFLRGAESGYFTDEDLHNTLQLFPKAELTTIPNAGHWLHAEQPTMITNSILYFFEE